MNSKAVMVLLKRSAFLAQTTNQAIRVRSVSVAPFRFPRLESRLVVTNRDKEILSVQNLSKNFGGVQAIDGVSLGLRKGAITGLIGPNGAGKTTLFNVISGYHKPSHGRVLLDGEDITEWSPNQLFGKGILRTFQIAHEFSTLTVRENLMVVPAGQAGETYFDAWFRPSRIRNQERALRDKADEVLDFLEITHVADELAGNLSGGQKKLLELGRTMMVDPRLVFLDEVGAGVNRTLLNSIITAVRRLNVEKGYTFCLIEHDMNFVSELCDHVYCMAEGSVLAEGSVEDILKNEEVIDAYLGRVRANKKVSPA